MAVNHRRVIGLLLIFALSGFAGLIYQAIWSHYLGLTLGHAAYAQTLVLAIFMGGMALGSWWVSRFGGRWGNLIIAYAIVELVIGLTGLAFHPVFLAYTEWSQNSVLPNFSDGGAFAFQWTSAVLLILPQCLLLGMTFPLMAAGCLRLDRDPMGGTLGGLYFTNSLGAAAGALVATFFLLPRIGMPGAMVVAGILNIVVAALAWLLSRDAHPAAVPATQERLEKQPQAVDSKLPAAIMVAAAITGATSFVYEIVWVRMLNQALGTTLHSFELMLAAFIFGLACGALWVHRKGDRIDNILRYAGFAQVGMGLAALISAIFFSNSFRWVAWLVTTLPRNDDGYAWFNLGSAAIALMVMFPAAFFAGMTLPLFTMSLLRRGVGESAIGRVYAANTVGAIIGVFLTVHVLVPGLGLHLSLVLAAILDVLLGIALLRFFTVAGRPRGIAACGVATVLTLLAVMLFGRPDPLAQASGVFRVGKLTDPAEMRVAYMADGKTSTISVVQAIGSSYAYIATNGKPDAGIMVDVRQPASLDEVTMVALGALPIALHPAPKDVAVIGWGSGLSTHTLLGSPAVRRVDSIEIEPAMYEGAKHFGPRVERAYRDKRSHVVFEDARTYFSAGNKKYDIIGSEPSNPWVSGVSSLFTEEFYAFTSRHLNEGGLMVQWLHTYEINDELLTRMIAALLKTYPHCDVYLANDFDLIFVASKSPLPKADVGRVAGGDLGRELSRVGLGGDGAFAMRRIGDAKLLAAYSRLFAAEGHSDYYPIVALRAPKARFLKEQGIFLQGLVVNGMPTLDLLQGRVPLRLAQLPSNSETSAFHRQQVTGQEVVEVLLGTKSPGSAEHVGKADIEQVEVLRRLSMAPVTPASLRAWTAAAADVAALTVGPLHPDDIQSVWVTPAWLSPGQPPEVMAVMAAYRAAALRDADAMRATSAAALALPPEGLSGDMRQQMLIFGMLAAAHRGDFQNVYALQERHGDVFAESVKYAGLASFLLAWSEPEAQ